MSHAQTVEAALGAVGRVVEQHLEPFFVGFGRGRVGNEFGLGHVKLQREHGELLQLMAGLGLGHPLGKPGQVVVGRHDRMAEHVRAGIDDQLLEVGRGLARHFALRDQFANLGQGAIGLDGEQLQVSRQRVAIRDDAHQREQIGSRSIECDLNRVRHRNPPVGGCSSCAAAFASSCQRTLPTMSVLGGTIGSRREPLGWLGCVVVRL